MANPSLILQGDQVMPGALTTLPAATPISGGTAIPDPITPANWFPCRPAGTPNTQTSILGQLTALPFDRVVQKCKVNAVAVRVGTASTGGGLIRIGIYACQTTAFLPGALIADCGTVSTDATGAANINVNGLNIILLPGTYFVATATVSTGTSAPSISCAAASPELTTLLGAPTPIQALFSSNAAGIVAGNGSVNTGGLLNPFPSPAIITAPAAPLVTLQLTPTT